MRLDPEKEFDKLIDAAGEMIIEHLRDNRGVLFQKWQQGKKAAPDTKKFVFGISAGIKIKEQALGEYAVDTQVSAASKAVIREGRLVRTGKDLIDEMEKAS